MVNIYKKNITGNIVMLTHKYLKILTFFFVIFAIVVQIQAQSKKVKARYWDMSYHCICKGETVFTVKIESVDFVDFVKREEAENQYKMEADEDCRSQQEFYCTEYGHEWESGLFQSKHVHASNPKGFEK